jgi:hypothetical protein
MTYRRRSSGSDAWHFCRNCTLDPKLDYDARSTEPTTGELCNQCKAKKKNGECTE